MCNNSDSGAKRVRHGIHGVAMRLAHGLAQEGAWHPWLQSLVAATQPTTTPTILESTPSMRRRTMPEAARVLAASCSSGCSLAAAFSACAPAPPPPAEPPDSVRTISPPFA